VFVRAMIRAVGGVALEGANDTNERCNKQKEVRGKGWRWRSSHLTINLLPDSRKGLDFTGTGLGIFFLREQSWDGQKEVFLLFAAQLHTMCPKRGEPVAHGPIGLLAVLAP